MEEVISLAGYPITVGVVASFLAQVCKQLSWIPVWKGEPIKIRILVGLVCVVLNVAGTIATGGDVSAVIALEALLSYIASAATYDHLFKA